MVLAAAVDGRRRAVVRIRVRRPIVAGRVQAAHGRERGRDRRGHRRRLGAVLGCVGRAVREDGRRAGQTVGRRERGDGRAAGPVQRACGAQKNFGPTADGAHREQDHPRRRQQNRRGTVDDQ